MLGLAVGSVLDSAGAATAAIARAAEDRLWREELFDPAVSGSVDCAAADHSCRTVARAQPKKARSAAGCSCVYAVLAVVGLVLAGRYLLSPLLKLVGKISERELFIVTGLFTVCASAAVMQMIGVSAALGAFVAGVMLAESPYRHELEADIDPFRSILLGLFFLAVGMMLDLDVIIAQPLLVVGLAAGADR